MKQIKKNISEIKLNDVIVIYVAVIALVLFYFLKKNQVNELKSYMGDYNFSIGKVEYFWKGKTIRTSIGKTSISYSYIISGNNFTKSYNSSFYKVPRKARKEELYLIIYNKSNPQNSLLLKDYPISNNQDFEQTVKKYKNDSPNIFE